MPAKTKEQIKQQAEKLLVDAGIDKRDAGYLAELYADSSRGKELTKDQPDAAQVANNCVGVGLIPL